MNTPWPEICHALESIVGKRSLLVRREELLVYECDGLTSYRQRPKVVVLPRSTAQVAAVVQVCDRYRVPFVPRGAGTGLSGGALPRENSILIVTTLMKEILRVDLENRVVVVQPGVVNDWVTQAVAGAGFFYAPDPSSQVVCSIGGNVAENSGGVHCLKYGVTTNHVLGLELVLPTGQIVHLGGDTPEGPGYDLTGLVVGAEGTLGIVTAVTLRILPVPEAVRVLLADFTTIQAAGAAVSAIIRSGILPGGMEIMDNLSINAVEDVVALGCYPRDAAAILLVEVDGSAAEIQTLCERVETLCLAQGARQVSVANTSEQRLRLWKGRKAAFAAAGHISPAYYVQDGVIPPSQLSLVLGRIEQLSREYGLPVANVFHAGDGNLHPLILYDHRTPGTFERVEALGGEILKLCVDVGGSISGEHGIGADKACYMPYMFDPADLETMGWVRRVFDPQGLANPEKVLPTPRTCGEASQTKATQFPGLEVF